MDFALICLLTAILSRFGLQPVLAFCRYEAGPSKGNWLKWTEIEVYFERKDKMFYIKDMEMLQERYNEGEYEGEYNGD